MTSKFASATTWMVLKDFAKIVAAFDDIDDAVRRFANDTSVSFQRAPGFLSRRRFVWGVVTAENQLDSVFGGDALSATNRALDLGGELKLFRAAVD